MNLISLLLSLSLIHIFKSTKMTSQQFCEELLKDQLVACVPGTAFGQAGEGFIRVSYAYSIEQIKEATTRIKKFLDKLDI